MSRVSTIYQLFLSIGLIFSVTACGGQNAANNPTTASPPATTTAESPKSDQSAKKEEPTPGEKANAEFKDKLTGAQLLAALQKGGHVIYFRHAQTDKDYADQADPKMSLQNCESQRKLSEVGIKQAKEIGAAFVAKKIPVGEVISSEYCRAWKTADLAFGKHQKNAKLNFLPFEDYTEAQVKEMKANVMPLLTAMPKTGQNTVIIGHDDIFEAATGIYPDPQGMAYVLTPDAKGGFTLQANMLPEEWSKIVAN